MCVPVRLEASEANFLPQAPCRSEGHPVLPHSTSSESQGPSVVLSARPSSSHGTSEMSVTASQGQGFLCGR